MRPHRRALAGALLCLPGLVAPAAGAAEGDVKAYKPVARRIITAAREDPTAWQRLVELTDTFGHRLSGSPQLEAALRWGAAQMRADGLENVRLEPVQVPHWVRGRESLELVSPLSQELVMLGLGNSVGTGPEGIEAELLIADSFEDLEARGEAAAGKIVLFNVPFTSYGETVRYRSVGTSRAARHGAAAMLLRSVGPTGLRTPHTGALRYQDDAPRIPAAALPVEDAQRLQRLVDAGHRVTLRLRMQAHFLPDATSSNLVAEIRGREHPEQVVLVGGHIDSWDVGTGAMDDAGGCVVTWQALRLIHKLGLRPRRTLRVVWFTNEENGLRGARAYAQEHAAELADHVAALESDSGVFRPKGFRFSGSPAARAIVESVAGLLEPIAATAVGDRGIGADIGPMVKAAGVPALLLDVEGERYFIYHHTPADTVERLDPGDVALGTAAVAVMAYVLADLPERLPR